MADSLLLGLFHETTPTADAIDQLEALGIPSEEITVMSGVPYRSEILGRHPRYERLGIIALVGALSGLLIALFLTIGTQILYPIHVGGQPLFAIPPTLIIVFEFTMLGTMIATFGGLLAESRFPLFGREAYDFKITEGHIGLVVRVPSKLLKQAKKILEENGAHHLQQMAAHKPVKRRSWLRWGLIVGLLFVPITVALLFTYSVIAIKLPDQMVDQPSIGYEEGPRLAAPAAAVPFTGPALIGGQPASQPVPATADSLQRGRILFSINCQMCHGDAGQGDGTLSIFFSPPPADLTAEPIRDLSDQTLFMIITEGRGIMPPLAENLDPGQRWDVINFVRNLQNSGAPNDEN